jgi:hypothetical protein
MSKYIYKNPLENGYKQFKLTRKQHNELFKFRKLKWTDKYEYYYNDKNILIHKFASISVIILVTVLFPINLLLYGLKDINEIIEEYKKMYNQKKYGSFVSDSIWSNTDTYKEIISIINNKKGK